MVDGFPCILDFPNFYGGGPPNPPYKGNTSTKPSKFFCNNNSSQRERVGKPSTIKTIYKNFIIRLYRNWKKGGGSWVKIFFVWFVIGLFETSICAIAEDKICDSRIVSSWALLIFFTLSVMTKFKFPVLCDYAEWRI